MAIKEMQLNHLHFVNCLLRLELFVLQFNVIKFHEFSFHDLTQQILHLHNRTARHSPLDNPLLPLALQHDIVPLAE